MTADRRSRAVWPVAGLLLGLLLCPMASMAQRPVRLFDPFYRDEIARRTFYDRYAFTADVSYRPAGTVQGDGLPATSGDLGVSFRFDYQLGPRFDLGALVDASGSNNGRTLALNWIVLKYYGTAETSDYALRLAVDPSADSRSGFPQADLAFLYTSPLGPAFTSDFALGMRRVRIGFQELVPVEVEPPGEGDPLVTPLTRFEATYARAVGWEVHALMRYNMLFDPAGSNMFVALLGESGDYTLLEWGPGTATTSDTAARTTTSYRGGVIWARFGLELQRPSYRLAPYAALPVQQWAPAEDGPRARFHAGVQLMLR